MTNNNRKCDDCQQTLNGACYVDGAMLLCGDCAENLDNERESYDETDGDIFDDRVDMYMNEY